MDYLIISPVGLSLFMVPSLAKRTEVKKIYFCVLDNKQKTLGQELNLLPLWSKLETTSDYWKIIKEHSKDNLIIVTDDVGTASLSDHLRNEGWKVVGGSEFTDKLEDDRTFSTELFSRIMKVPESYDFHSFADLTSFIKGKGKDQRWVFKPHDGLVPKDMTYVSKDQQDLLQTIDTYKSEWKLKEDFQLQEFVDGTLVDFGGWFNGKEWLENSHYLYFEEKPFLVGNIGPATGGEVAVLFYKKNEGKFFDILEKFKPALQKVGYVGQISVNAMVSEDKREPYFLEITPRFGYPSFPQDITALEDNGKYLHDLFTALVNQEKGSNLFIQKKIVVTLVASTPPYPNKNTEVVKGLPVSWDHKYDMYFYPYYVMYDEKKKTMVLTGEDALTLNITCVDETLDGAVAMLYDNYLPTLHLKNMQYRNDLGKHAKERIKKLKSWGLL